MTSRPITPWLAVFASVFLAPSYAADIIQCPIGTRYVAPANVSAHIRSETCVDALGRKQGPFRLWSNHNGIVSVEGAYRDGFLDGAIRSFNEAGELLGESLYADGALIANVPTLAALQAALEEENSKAGAAGKRRTIMLLDRHTIGIDYVKEFPLSTFFAAAAGSDLNDEIHRKLISNPEFCGMFKSPEFSILLIRARWHDESGKLLGEIWLRKEECGDQPDL